MRSHTHEQLARRQPPGTGEIGLKTLKRRYGQRLRGAWIKIRSEMRRGIVERDIFGLTADTTGPFTDVEQLADDFDPADLTPVGYDPTDDARNHRRFMAWLREQQRRGVLEIISRDNNIYVRRAADRGVRWAEARLREAGESVDHASLDAVFRAPVSGSSLRLLYERNYDLLEGITSDVSSQISEELTRGFAEGLGPNEVAENIADRIDSVGQHRSTLLARNEIQYAANQASLRRYRSHGVTRVEILGTNPCPQCRPHVGETYAIDDPPTFGFPPYHPQCRCCVSPSLDT